MAETDDQEAVYNLKAVLQETGLKADTLRAWEKRYGVPHPQRTAGKHRLYSRQDIVMLHWLVERQHEGLTISRAVELWQRQHSATIQQPPPPTDDGMMGVLRQRWVLACLSFDEHTAQQVLNQAFVLYNAEQVCMELIQVAIREIGEGWQRGSVTVQQEHFTTGLATRRLESLIAALPTPTRRERLLLACPPDELHTLGLLILHLLLRRQGFDVINLGARVPLASFYNTLLQTRPHLVILSAQQLHTAAAMLELATLLAEHRLPVMYGGRVFNLIPALRQHIPGTFLGETVSSATQIIETILSHPRFDPQWQVASEAHRDAYSQFRAAQLVIGNTVWEAIKTVRQLSYDQLSHINLYFSQCILAALKFGDIAFLEMDINWVAVMIAEQGWHKATLLHYLSAYASAVRACMGEAGTIISDGIDALVHQNTLQNIITE